MTKFAFIFMLHLLVLATYSQTVEVNGTLRDNEGNPLPGANVVIKGTNQGTVADVDGNYTIEAPVGAILVVSYIGYLPMEFEVTNTGKAKFIKKQATPPPPVKVKNNIDNRNRYYQPDITFQNPQDTTGSEHDPENGIAVMSPQMKYKIKGEGSLFYLKFKGIRRHIKNDFLVFNSHKPYLYYAPKIDYSSSCYVDKINNLPKLQHTYAQGRPINGELRWLGPESETLFAWGPALSQLEYDGSDYAYDKNGRLAPVFSGNGQYPNSYNPYDFFQNGLQLRNSIRVEHQIRRVKYFIAFRNNHQKDIIPLSQFDRNTLDAGFKTERSKLKLEGDFTLSDVKSKNSDGSILSYHILKSVLLTPPTFDNSNALGKNAIKNGEAYLTSFETPRSAAVNLTDNPYWLINNSIDNLNARMAMSTFKISYKLYNQIKLNIVTHCDNQVNRQQTGITGESYLVPGGRYFNRKNTLSSFGSIISLDNQEYYIDNFKFTGWMNYQFNREIAGLEKLNSPAYPIPLEQDILPYNYKTTRTTNRINAKLNMDYRNLILFSAQAHEVYFSDIKDAAGYKGGAVTGGLVLSEIHGIRRNMYIVDYLKIYGSYGNDFKAPPLLTDAAQYTSVSLSANELNDFFPSREIIYDQTLLPETIRTLNTGMDIIFQRNIGLTINWYNKNTVNAILPDYQPDNEIRLKNLADLRSRGLELTINTEFGRRRWEFYNELNLTTGQTRVTSLYNGLESIPLAGFEFISSNAVKGEPLGVLMGTAYQRDASGKILIDNSGFPVVATEKRILGNPSPKWTAGLLNSISYRNFEISVIWEWKHGGKIWNGTKASLDYYGLSATTGEQRNIRNYVFEGNSSDGNPNTIGVDFANPNDDFEANRWIRYGLTGVAEDYIEDAGWFRIRSLTATYTFKNIDIQPFKDIKIGMHVNNIILKQKYSGVDPESALFGQPGGTGLDYFNMPSTRSYGVMLEMRL